MIRKRKSSSRTVKASPSGGINRLPPALPGVAPIDAKKKSSQLRASSSSRTQTFDSVGIDNATPFIDLPIKPIIPAALDDGTIPVALLKAPVQVEIPLWSDAKPRDRYTLRIAAIGGTFTDVASLTLPNPPVDPVKMAIPVAILEGLDDGLYFLQVNIVSFPGGDDYNSEVSTFTLDRTPPGGDVLPPIDFPEDIDRDGLTLAQLLQMPEQELRGIVPNYEFQAIGDILSLKMKLRDGGAEIDAGTVTVMSRSGQIDVAFDRATLEKVTGAGLVDFYYLVADKAGNARPNAAAPTPVRMLIDGAPEDIPAPHVPGFDDGLVTDPDARAFMLVEIPVYDPPALEGDFFYVHVGNQRMTTPPLKAEDLANDPLLVVEYPYLMLYQQFEVQLDPVFSVDVWYDVVREGLSSPSERVKVDFDLRIPGGPDPIVDPDDPSNEALGKPILRGATGGTDNLIIPADADVDATAFVPWNNTDPTPKPSFLEGDTIQLYLDDEAAGNAYEVTAADALAGDDLELVMPSAVMLAHVGTPDLWYEVVRTLDSTPAQEVTVVSPAQMVTIQSLDEVPGGGDPLAKVRFTKAAYRENDGNPYAQNTDATRADGGALVRFGEYVNMAVDDVIEYTFQGYDGFDPENGDGDPVDGTLYTNTHRVTATDLLPRVDDTVVPPVTHPYVEILVPQAYIWPIVYGSATLDYTVKNALGEGTGEQDLVYMDVRGGPAGSDGASLVAKTQAKPAPRARKAAANSRR